MTEVEQLRWQLKSAREDYDALYKAYVREQLHSNELCQVIRELQEKLSPQSRGPWLTTPDEVPY